MTVSFLKFAFIFIIIREIVALFTGVYAQQKFQEGKPPIWVIILGVLGWIERIFVIIIFIWLGWCTFSGNLFIAGENLLVR